MDLVQKRKQLRQRQVDKVKRFRQSNMSASAAVEKQREVDATERQKESTAKQKQREREQMKKEVRKEIEKETQRESMNIENSDGTTFARVMDIVGPTHMRPLVSNGVWKGTEQISEKKSDCECDDCGQDPCIECGESHHSVKEELVSERLGGKGYKPYTSLTGQKVSGDWEYSDWGSGNRARTRAIKKGIKGVKPVEKKSPTYQAHVLNKEEDNYGQAKKELNATKKARDERYRSIHSGTNTTKNTDVNEDYYSGTGEKVVARTKEWMKKKGKKGAPGLDDMKARTAEHEAKRGVKEEVVAERTNSSSTLGDLKTNFKVFSGDRTINNITNVTKGGQGAVAALGAIGGASALHYGKKAAKSVGKSVKKTKDKIKSKFKKEEYSDWRSEIDEGLTPATIGTAAALGVVGGAASAIGNMSAKNIAKKLSKKKKTDEEKKESYNWREDKNMRINKILNS